tara:strand:- start:23 stop:2536 length:2514 start_codon:yes stop_codon:yes gene_type:complete
MAGVGYTPTFDETVEFRRAIIAEINAARTRPALYAYKLLARARRFKGKLYYHDKKAKPVKTIEGVVPVKQVAKILRRMDPLPPVCRMPAGLCKAAMDHVRDIGPAGLYAHKGTDGSTTPDRIRRYGTLDGGAENLSFGAHTAEHVVCGMLIDDGIPDRRYRHSLLEDDFDCIGIAHGPHKKAGKCCVIVFARNYLPGLGKGFLKRRKPKPMRGFVEGICELRILREWKEANKGMAFGAAALNYLEFKYDKDKTVLLKDCTLRCPSVDSIAKGIGFDLTINSSGKVLTFVEDPSMLSSLVIKLSIVDAVMCRANQPPIVAKINLPRSMGKLIGQTHAEMKLLEQNKDLMSASNGAVARAAMLHSEAIASVAAHRALTNEAETRDAEARAALAALEKSAAAAQKAAKDELTELTLKLGAAATGDLEPIMARQRALAAELAEAEAEAGAATEAAVAAAKKESEERDAALIAAHESALSALRAELSTAVSGMKAETEVEAGLRAEKAALQQAIAEAKVASEEARAAHSRQLAEASIAGAQGASTGAALSADAKRAAAAALEALRVEFTAEREASVAAAKAELDALRAASAAELAAAVAAAASSGNGKTVVQYSGGADAAQMAALQAQIGGLHSEFAEALAAASAATAAAVEAAVANNKNPLTRAPPPMVPTQMLYNDGTVETFNVLHSPAAPIFAPRYPFSPRLSVDPDALLREQQRVHGAQIGMVEQLLSATEDSGRRPLPSSSRNRVKPRRLPQWARASKQSSSDPSAAHAEVNRVARYSEGLLGSDFHRGLDGLSGRLATLKSRADGGGRRAAAARPAPPRRGLASAAEKLSGRRQYF